jgi:hypothetical protein
VVSSPPKNYKKYDFFVSLDVSRYPTASVPTYTYVPTYVYQGVKTFVLLSIYAIFPPKIGENRAKMITITLAHHLT